MEKKLAIELKQIKQVYPHAQVQLWCEDEHRLGLKPIIRRIYVPEGCQPIANINWKFEWLWLYAFVHPTHSPELQPAERLWTLVDEPIANRSFENLDQLEEVLCQRCQILLKQQDLIQGLTSFHWWIQIDDDIITN